MASANTLNELLIEELRDLYDAEHQLTEALPKMARAASNEKLREGFQEHLEQTKGHIERLERALELLGGSAKRKTCKAMKGLLEEGAEKLDMDGDKTIRDCALIGAAQKVEHYEIAGYGTVRSYAEVLGESDVAELLQATLDEESATDEKLTEIAESINETADTGESR